MSDYPGEMNSVDLPKLLLVLAVGCAGCALLIWPRFMLEMVEFVMLGLLAVAPIVLPGIVLAAWIMASGAGGQIARLFGSNLVYSILAASAFGAITPVCGVTVLPLMAGLLAAGVPLAPVMAFWLSSPVTDPAMLATTAATLGVDFAFGKTAAAFGLGLWGGAITTAFSTRAWAKNSLRSNRIVESCHNPIAARHCRLNRESGKIGNA